MDQQRERAHREPLPRGHDVNDIHYHRSDDDILDRPTYVHCAAHVHCPKQHYTYDELAALHAATVLIYNGGPAATHATAVQHHATFHTTAAPAEHT